MLLFLLPLIFNPFSFIVRWLPALYLAAWPIIIQTLGQDALLLHALLLIMFILTCDITRDFMLRLIGIDLISMPVGALFLAALLSNKGSTFLSYVVPVLGTLLVVVEPMILISETCILMEMVKVFNKWISKMSNIRDEDSSDLSTWEPPLTRGSIIMRFVVILITIASYFGAYMIIQAAKQLSTNENIMLPIHFNHAISLLVTIQLIALTSTIYKEAGVLSESAMAVLMASIPIFIASWSFYHMKLTAASSSWTSWFPFSIFASGSGGGPFDGPLTSMGQTAGNGILASAPRERRIVFDDQLDGYQSSGAFGFGSDWNDNQLDYGALERSIHLISPTDNIFKQALLAFFRQLIMLINSILGLSWDKLTKYYFGTDFWCILGGRLVCLIWWIVSASKSTSNELDGNGGGRLRSVDDDGVSSSFKRFSAKLRRLNSKLPIGRTTIIKCLIVLVYAQMLIKEMDNKTNLEDQTSLLYDGDNEQTGAQQLGGCCSSSQQSLQGEHKVGSNLLDTSTSWLQCVWNSAKACAGTVDDGASGQIGSDGVHASRASRFFETMLSFAGQCLATLLTMFAHVYNRLLNSHMAIYYIYTLWLVRWRSSIIQRLMQSVFIQIYYICSILFSRDDDDD